MKTYLTAIRWTIYCALFILAICSCNHINRPKNYIEQDSLFSQIRILLSRSEWKAAIALNGNYIKNAYQNHDQYGIVLGYINIGNIYHTRSDNKNALLFLNKASEEIKGLKNPVLNARLASEYCMVYSSLNLNYKAQQYYNKAFEATQKIIDVKKQTTSLSYLYSIKAQQYEDKAQYDSMVQVLHQGLSIQPDPNLCIRLAKYFLNYNPNIDSAKYYLERADTLITKRDYPLYYKGFLSKVFGDLYYKKLEYDRAITCYQAAANIFSKDHSISGVKQSYDGLSKSYKEKGDMTNSRIYLEKYIALSDSSKKAKESVVEISVKDIEQQYIQQYAKAKGKVVWLITGLLSLFIVIALFVLRILKTKEQRTLERLTQIEEEAQTRHQKILSSTFEDLVDLAKQNSPNFYTRFKEVYPQWHKKILDTAPDLTITELRLCAYIFLDFQTKEIADLTFRAVRTIQLGKNRIRKKLKIASDVDINLWLKNLVV